MMSVHVLDSLCVCMLILVALHVQGQVVGAREAAAAGNALERFGAGVLAVVSGELVRPGEAPVAVVPRAAIRLLTCNAEKQEGGISSMQTSLAAAVGDLVAQR